MTSSDAAEYPDATGRALVEYGAAGSVAAYIQDLKAQRDDLLATLELIESVYRLNCVAEGEPSSVLDAIQAAIARAR